MTKPRRREPEPQPKSAPPRARVVYLIGAALIVLLTFVIYAQTLPTATLEFDDSFHLVHSPYVNVPHPFAGLGAVWDQPYFGFFDPVTTTSWLIDRAAADQTKPFDAAPFRVSQLLYAIACALLLIALYRRLGLPPILAAAGAVIFAVHPIHTEVVAWLSGRKDLMVMLFILLAFLAYLWARDSATPRQWRTRHALTAIFTLLAVLAKPAAIVLPFLFLAYEFCAEPISKRILTTGAILVAIGGVSFVVFRAMLLRDPVHGGWLIAVAAAAVLALAAARGGLTIPFAVQGVILGAGAAWTVWAQSQAGAIKGGLPLLPTLNLTFDAMLDYAAKVVAPFHMSAYYAWTAYPPVSLRGIGGVLFVGGTVAAAIAMARAKDPRWRMTAFGILWYWIAFLPTSNLVPTSIKMADRYEFVPSVGAILFLLVLAQRRPRAGVAALAVLTITYTAWSHRRTQDWSSDLALWTSAVETHPDNYWALNSLALVHLREEPPRPEIALPLLQRALAIGESIPNLDVSPELEATGDAYLAMARSQHRQEDYAKAAEFLERGSRVPWGFAPADARLQHSLAEAREGLAGFAEGAERTKLRDAADDAIRRAREILIAGNVSRDGEDFRGAAIEAGTMVFRRAAGASPEEQPAIFRKALALYEDAASLLPDDPRPVFYQGLCYQRLHLLALGDAVLHRALALRRAVPEYNPVMPYQALASLYADAGDYHTALGYLKQARQADPEYSRLNNVDRDIATLERLQ